jgi:hypothetical protein
MPTAGNGDRQNASAAAKFDVNRALTANDV